MGILVEFINKMRYDNKKVCELRPFAMSGMAAVFPNL